MDGMADLFSKGSKSSEPSDAEIKDLHVKIERLIIENDFLAQGLKK